MTAPNPKLTAEAEPFIPYVKEEDYPDNLRALLEPYAERMGFIPNALKLYMHRPEIAETVWTLNDRVMRHRSSTLDPFLKRRLGAVASKTNGCTYCTSHNCRSLKNEADGAMEGWGLADEEVRALLSDDLEPADEFERACFDYVRVANLDPGDVSDKILERLKQHLNPPQIMELACLVGFWKFYNTIHASLHIPLEAALLDESGYVDV